MWNSNHPFRRVKRLALILGATAVTVGAQAQVGSPRSDLAIGFTGGVNLSRVSFFPTVKQSMLPGPNVGATIRYTCEKYLTCVCAIQLECNLAQQGWKEKIEDGSNNTYSCVMNYAQIPLLCRLAWGRERRGFQGYIVLGPQLGLFLNKKEKYGGDPWDVSNRPNHVTAQYGKAPENKMDYGIAAGAGMQFSNKLGHFLLEARYYYGLSDFYHNSKKDPFSRSANSAIQLKVGYLFDLIKTNNSSIK